METNSSISSVENDGKSNSINASDLVLMMTKSAHRGYRKIFKDIEISKQNILILTAITFGVTCLVSVSIYFTVDAFERDQFLGGTGVVFGLLIGIVLGGFFVDRIERKFPILTALLGLSPLFCVWGYFAKSSPDLYYANILLSINLAIGIFLTILLLTMYIQYTTMLERGRIIAIIISANSILSIGIIVLMFQGYFVLIPAIFPMFVAIWLYNHRIQEKTSGQVMLLEKGKRNLVENSDHSNQKIPDNPFVNDINNDIILIGVIYKTRIAESLVIGFTTQLNISSDITVILLESSISSIVFIGCIGVLFILANISQDLSKDEQNWPEALIHMYAIHNSGLLLYEHTFRQEKGLATADLVSGGIIGLVSMLKEITQGNQNLRIIDHGDKKLLFQWNPKEQVVFVFVIERELVIIRNKLSQFIVEFDQKYEKYLRSFNGVDDSVWNSVKELVEQYFTRRYLTLIPGTEHFLLHSLDSKKKDKKI